MFDVSNIAENIVSQIGFIILVIMAVRAVISYLREDWMGFFSGLIMGLLCMIVVFFGPQLQELARTWGNALFG
ncbi:hypothetical protein GCM10022378_00120 [Salinicoccus jeotgali]|uniref:Stage III sporulation protein AC n=1 Tax=Salinicoccus jeotgali TaxID=381634 RepID=A0ABP7E766_9STAP